MRLTGSGVYAEALACVFAFCLSGKNHDKGEPRELAGEPNTAAVGFFSGCPQERGQRLKKTKELP